SAELAREQFIRERIAEQEDALRREHEDLESTRQVLQAMNQSLQLIGAPATDMLLDGQLKLLQGVLGYRSAAILLPEGERLQAAYLSVRSSKPKHSVIGRSEVAPFVRLLETPFVPKSWVTVSGDVASFGDRLGSAYLLAMPLAAESRVFGMLVLG